ncbi:MAG: VOC family protein [Bacteroidota bacterium]
MITNRSIDHLVYAVPDFNAALDDIEEMLGIRPQFGGRHLRQGTKNALLHLGEACYFEVLAIDEENLHIKGPRWMGVDLITAPKLTRWCLKSSNLVEDSAVLRAYHPTMGQLQGGQRQLTNGELLKWEMALPLSEPAVEIIPFMADWAHSSIHPTDQLAPSCELVNLQLTHPHPGQVLPTLRQLSLGNAVEEGAAASIRATIRGPKGTVVFY